MRATNWNVALSIWPEYLWLVLWSHRKWATQLTQRMPFTWACDDSNLTSSCLFITTYSVLSVHRIVEKVEPFSDGHLYCASPWVRTTHAIYAFLELILPYLLSGWWFESQLCVCPTNLLIPLDTMLLSKFPYRFMVCITSSGHRFIIAGNKKLHVLVSTHRE